MYQVYYRGKDGTLILMSPQGNITTHVDNVVFVGESTTYCVLKKK